MPNVERYECTQRAPARAPVKVPLTYQFNSLRLSATTMQSQLSSSWSPMQRKYLNRSVTEQNQMSEISKNCYRGITGSRRFGDLFAHVCVLIQVEEVVNHIV